MRYFFTECEYVYSWVFHFYHNLITYLWGIIYKQVNIYTAYWKESTLMTSCWLQLMIWVVHFKKIFSNLCAVIFYEHLSWKEANLNWQFHWKCTCSALPHPDPVSIIYVLWFVKKCLDNTKGSEPTWRFDAVHGLFYVNSASQGRFFSIYFTYFRTYWSEAICRVLL